MTDAELVQLLDDVRPGPEPAWAARLDAQVERGFVTAPKPRRARPRWRVPALALGTACAVVLLIVLAVTTRAPSGGFGGGNASSGGAGISSERAPATAAPNRRLGTPAPGPIAPGGGGSGRPRQVERAADLTLTAPRDRVPAVADGIVRATEAAGGYVQSSNVSSGKYGGADFALRVPSSALARTLSAFSSLAHVQSLNQSTNDITAVVNDARARVRDRQAERASLRRQLAATSDPTLAAKLQTELRRATRRVDAARRALARQRSRASFATVIVTVEGRAGGGPSGGGGGAWTPGDALRDAGRVLEVAAGVALIALAVALPLGLLGGLGWAGARVIGRRRRERLLDMA